MSIVLCTDPLPETFVEMGQAMVPSGATFVAVPSLDEADFAELAADAEVLFVVHRRVDERLLSHAPRLRLIQCGGIGYENIDVDAAAVRGIPVCYTPGANAGAVAEHAILLMLALLKRFVQAEEATRAGQWPQMEMAAAGLGDLDGTTVGLVGLGRTGRAVAERLAPYGCRLVYHTRRRLDPALEALQSVSYSTLPDLLAAAQIVSLHLPLTAATRHLMGDEQFAQMPQGSYLINVSRGGLVDEAALRRAVERGHLAGAGLDTIEVEEDGGNPFTDLPQVIVTPHTAGPTRRGVDAIIGQAFANINRVLAGEPPQDLVPEMEHLGAGS